MQHGHCLVLTVALADPFLPQTEFGRGRGHMGRREVASAGQHDAVGADAVQQPGVGADHPGCGLGIDVGRLRQGSVGQPPQLPPVLGCPDCAGQLFERPGGAGSGPRVVNAERRDRAVGLVYAEENEVKDPGMDVIAIETAELADCRLWLGCSGSMAAEISS